MVLYLYAVLTALVLHAAIVIMIRRFGWRKENFKNEKVLSVSGLYIIAYGAVGAVMARYTPLGSDFAARLYLVGILGFGAFGFADDLFGSRDVGGFLGHFKKLFKEGKLTTGALKALGGGILAVYLSYRTSGGTIWLWALDAATIALAANTVNLLDLRPGRALFVFFLGIALAVVLAGVWLSAPVPVFAVMLSAAVVAYYDVRGKAMLGDVGSNTLGAVLGLTLALDTGPAAKIAFAVVFLAINLYSERRSISALIERHPLLRSLDSRLGVR
ncbi:MAG: hypothetical protein HYX78_15340 [Armatimonadetes bacterium]|nr:hypothetical protein [Armatimonadota bacterium]